MRIVMMARCAALVLAATSFGVGAAPDARARTVQASVQSVMQAFVDAVYAYCVPSIMTGTRLADLSTDGRPQSLEPAIANRGLVSDDSAWAIAGLGEIVVLQELQGEEACRVSAYGPPVAPVFNVVAMAIGQPSLDFVEVDTSRPPENGFVDRKFESRSNGMVYTVFLGGNEPGAPGTRSRFSTLMATVRARPIEPDTEAPAAGEQ